MTSAQIQYTALQPYQIQVKCQLWGSVQVSWTRSLIKNSYTISKKVRCLQTTPSLLKILGIWDQINPRSFFWCKNVSRQPITPRGHSWWKTIWATSAWLIELAFIYVSFDFDGYVQYFFFIDYVKIFFKSLYFILFSFNYMAIQTPEDTIFARNWIGFVLWVDYWRHYSLCNYRIWRYIYSF